ncbi:hypothetical protein E2C01_080869 [Portunus trituberculatus]|uniref:Uncharacterized protein n=1 Tax=Portunus trituberculatus TaxID=210409 RepID=A0A5B7IX78_PORTR|nr:hypothetical protein [Portunus trituberculatus]
MRRERAREGETRSSPTRTAPINRGTAKYAHPNTYPYSSMPPNAPPYTPPPRVYRVLPLTVHLRTLPRLPRPSQPLQISKHAYAPANTSRTCFLPLPRQLEQREYSHTAEDHKGGRTRPPRNLDIYGRRGTVELCVLWGPRGLQAQEFESYPRSECRLGFLT